jgi:O-antigen/teichoic acid export membrane protein
MTSTVSKTTSPRRPLSVLDTFKNSSKISSANLLNGLVMLPVNILVARILGPELLGVVGIVTLWQLYASLSKLGIFNAAYRELPPLLAAGKTERATYVQNIGITGEALYLLLPITVMLWAGWTQGNPLLRWGLMLSALTFGLMEVLGFATHLQWAHQRFGLIAKTTFLSTIVNAGFLLGTVSTLKVYAPLLAPGLSALVLLGAYALWSPALGYKPQWDWQELWRLLKIGLPLGLLSIFYWGFRTVDRAVIAESLPLTAMGQFTFIMQFINIAISVVADFGNVLQPTLWAELGPQTDWEVLRPRLRRLSWFILAVTCAGATAAQAGFGAFVYWFVPRFSPSIPTFETLAFLLACGTAGFVPVHLLTSAYLNRQKLVAAIYGIGVPLNVALAYSAVRLGWGINGVAVSSVVAQALVSGILLWVMRHYYARHTKELIGFYASLIGLVGVSLVIFIIYQTGPFAFVAGGSIVVALIWRLGLAGIIWGVLGGFTYRQWQQDVAQFYAQSATPRPSTVAPE